jgi:hypothetical protein
MLCGTGSGASSAPLPPPPEVASTVLSRPWRKVSRPPANDIASMPAGTALPGTST